MMRCLVVLALVPLGACATVAPPAPRFITMFEQRSVLCRIQVLQDTRSSACFIAFKCGRQPVEVLLVEDRVCVP